MAAPFPANTMPVAQAQPVVATMITSDQGSKMIGTNQSGNLQGGPQGFGGVAPGQGGINFGGVPVQPIMAPPQPVNGMMQPVMRVNVSPVITSRTDAILPPKPMGRFYDSLWDCHEEPGTCCMVWCCTCVPVAQMSERLLYKKSWLKVVVGLGLIQIIMNILISVEQESSRDTAKKIETARSIFNFIFDIICFIFVFQFRQEVRHKYNIQERTCATIPGCEDCLCAWFCWYCALCQIIRHVNQGAKGCNLTLDGLDAGYHERNQREFHRQQGQHYDPYQHGQP